MAGPCLRRRSLPRPSRRSARSGPSPWSRHGRRSVHSCALFERRPRGPQRPALYMSIALQRGRCLIIGEVGLAHDGSLGYAHAFIDEVARAGADAVKFQTHIASAESTPAEPFRVKFSRQDATRYDYWKRMEFTEEQWRGLAQHAQDRKLLFLTSPFSLETVDLLEPVGTPM